MPSTRHKIKRKELKQPDEFVNFVDSAEQFFLDNWRKLLIALGIVAVFGVAVILTYNYERGLDRATAAQFMSALDALNAGNYKGAEQGLSELAKTEPNRRLGRLSRLYLASAYIGDNQLQKARETLVAFLADEHDPTFANLALTNLAVVYERMGDYKQAAVAYRQAAAEPGPEQLRAELGAARMLAKSGHKSAAIAAYRDFLENHPLSEQRSEVMQSLAMLGASAKPAPVPAPVAVAPAKSKPAAPPAH
jgi:predicted negative regulator of RcsB-dependent stress response